MKRHLLSLAIAFLFSAAALTQAESVSLDRYMTQGCEPVWQSAARTPAVSPMEGQLWWANYDLDASTRYVTGTSIAEHYEAAVFIPQGLLTEGSTTVDGFSFYALADSVKNVSVWVCPFLPASPNDWTESVSLADSVMEKGKFNDVAFTNHHEIPKDGLYVGVSFDVTSLNGDHANTPLAYTSTDSNRENSFFYKTASKLKWTAVNGNAYVKVLLGSSHFKKNAVAVNKFATGYVLKGESVGVPVFLRNMGTADVENISYTITTDGVTSDEITKAVSIKGFQTSGSTTIDFPADTETKSYQKTLTITKVNGEGNESPDSKTEGQIITMAKTYQATPVVETFIGTGFSSSPGGIVGMEKTEEKYGDQAVLINVHCKDMSHYDPMAIEDYEPMIYNVQSIPTAFLNREYSVTPSSHVLPSSVATALKRTVPAKIGLEAEWNADVASATSIKLTSSAEFCYDDEKANYGVAYVILADSLKGTGTDWEQSNGYSGESGSDDMKFWLEAPASVAGIVYNHVPIAAKDIFSGAGICEAKGVKAGEPLTNTATINLSDNKLVQDKTMLKAVVLLIDRSNNQIVNAAKTMIATTEQGIDDLNTDSNDAISGCYDIAGHKVSMVHKGISIVKMANGKTMKIVK